MSFVWTEEAVERLKTLHAEGLSGAELATRLGSGLTRSAIFGKLHRLGLTGKRGPATQIQRSRLARGHAASGFAEHAAAASARANASNSSWPGNGPRASSRPSTNFCADVRNVDARVKPGHDGKRYGALRFNFARKAHSVARAAAPSFEASLPAPDGKLPPPSLEIGITEIGPDQCRFIAGDNGLACGHETLDGSSWCPAHRAVVFAPEEGA